MVFTYDMGDIFTIAVFLILIVLIIIAMVGHVVDKAIEKYRKNNK